MQHMPHVFEKYLCFLQHLTKNPNFQYYQNKKMFKLPISLLQIGFTKPTVLFLPEYWYLQENYEVHY